MYTKELVRKAYHRDGKSQRQIARELGLHRDTVRKLLAKDAEEIPHYKQREKKHRPVLGPYVAIIDQWLQEDEQAPRKQRHTAKRIFERLKDEYGFEGGYSTVKDYLVQVRKKPVQVYLPLAFQPGEMGQVDWGTVEAVIAAVRQKLQLFTLVLNYSGAHYVQAFDRQNQESFFEGHANAFVFFGGVPRTLTYDNLKSAVNRILQGKAREENERFVAFRSAWLFESRFCNPAKGNEKGRVENMVKYAERNYFTPLPVFGSLDELNAWLRERCLAYQQTCQARQRETVSERLALEKPHLLTLPAHLPQCYRILPVNADKSALVQFETNRYSVPSEYAYKSLWLKAFVGRIEITDEKEVLAVHTRLYGKYQESIRFEHYRKVLERKPGAKAHLRATHGVVDIAESRENKPLSPYPTVTVHPPNIQQYALLLKEFH